MKFSNNKKTILKFPLRFNQNQEKLIKKISNFMASLAKIQKSFQDYFRIPILLKALGNTTTQTLSNIASVLNQIDRFSINQDLFVNGQNNQNLSYSQKNKKNLTLQQRLKRDLKNRGNGQSQKLLFLSEDFNNDWSQFEVIYKVNFVILVFSGDQQKQQNNQNTQNTNDSSKINLNETIQKMNIRLKQKDKKLLGIIFLNDAQQFSKTLVSGLKFTIIPQSLPLQQLSMFIQPWLVDLIPTIQKRLLQTILECRQQENNVIVFNRSQQKSQPKIMKRKKKYRSLKISGDLALMLHLYQYAFQSYQQADEQLRKVDDWLWALGCVQGKLACMTCNAQITTQNIQKQIQQLINESFILSKKLKYQFFQIENLFKILKLLLHEDKQRFDDMVEITLASSKGLTQDQKFFYYSYIGSLYEKAGMQRKRNCFYYKASLITQNFKPQISQILLKTIKTSKFLQQWQYLHSRIIQKIISGQNYFNPSGQIHLQLIQKCRSVLSQKQTDSIRDYLNLGNFQEVLINQSGYKLIEIKQFCIEQSNIKPKPNRLIVDESPKKVGTSSIFVGWKKKQTWLYEDQQGILFKGTILNKLPFEAHLKIYISSTNQQSKYQQFSIIIPPLQRYKFSKVISYRFRQQLITIKRIKLQMWNFIFYKEIQPQINFQLYEKQPDYKLSVEGSQVFFDEKQKLRTHMQQSSQFQLRCNIIKTNHIECDKLRITCSIYYDIDVGFQQNQYNLSVQNRFCELDLSKQTNNQKSNEKQAVCEYDKTNQVLVCKVKKFKTTRNHIKRIQINLDYIKYKSSKYQINKQYTIEPTLTNSVWAEVVEISTPQLQSAIHNIQNPTQFQIKQMITNWNLIEEYYLARVKFYKDKFNLRPFKITYSNNQNNNQQVISKNEVILSNLVEGEMWIKLKKKQISLNQKQLILSNPNIQPQMVMQSQLSDSPTKSSCLIEVQQSRKNSQFRQIVNFEWQNIVNKNMHGSINLQVKPNPLIFSPKIQFQTQIKRVQLENSQTQSSQNSKNRQHLFQLLYRMSSSTQKQLKSHKIIIKPYNEHQNYLSSNNAEVTVFKSDPITKNPMSLHKNIKTVTNSSTGASNISNQGQGLMNNEDDHTPVNNTTILIKGKTRIQKVKPIKKKQFDGINNGDNVSENNNSKNKDISEQNIQIKNKDDKKQNSYIYYYENKLNLKIIKQQKPTDSKKGQLKSIPKQKLKCIIIIQFDQKQLGKWQHVLTIDQI